MSGWFSQCDWGSLVGFVNETWILADAGNCYLVLLLVLSGAAAAVAAAEPQPSALTPHPSPFTRQPSPLILTPHLLPHGVTAFFFLRLHAFMTMAYGCCL